MTVFLDLPPPKHPCRIRPKQPPPLFHPQLIRPQHHTILSSLISPPSKQSPHPDPTPPVHPLYNPDDKKHSPNLIRPQSPKQARPIYVRRDYKPNNPSCPVCGHWTPKLSSHILNNHVSLSRFSFFKIQVIVCEQPNEARAVFALPHFEGYIKCQDEKCPYKGQKRSGI